MAPAQNNNIGKFSKQEPKLAWSGGWIVSVVWPAILVSFFGTILVLGVGTLKVYGVLRL